MWTVSSKPNPHSINFVDLDKREEFMDDRMRAMQDLKAVQICSQSFQTSKIGTSLSKSKEE